MTLTREQKKLKEALDELVRERDEYGDRIVSLDFAYTSAIEKIAGILGIEAPSFE